MAMAAPGRSARQGNAYLAYLTLKRTPRCRGV